MVRVWNPRTGNCAATAPTRHMPQAVAKMADSLAMGTDSGIIVIRPGATG
jgi:hypothetical protein